MRRRLHAFLIAFLTLALSMDAARACWFLRARRQCRPVVVSTPCPPPEWSGCGEVVARDWAVSEVCCQPAPACHAGSVESYEPAVTSDVVVERPAESPTRSVIREQPTEAAGGNVSLTPAATQPESPEPGDAELVQPASNNEPLPDLEPVEPPATAALPADEPVSPRAEVEPEMRAQDLADEEMLEDEDAAGPPLPPVTENPVDEAEEMADEVPPPKRPLPPIPGIDDDEPPPAEETAEPAPAMEPGPEAEPNLFEEFEDGAATGEDDSDAEMAPGEANPFADDQDPDPPVDPEVDEPAPADDDPPMTDEDADAGPPSAADDDEPPMADDEDGAAAEPAVPGDSDEEPLPLPADESDPFAGADDSDSLTAAEPVRRWIHASGAHSLVARLVDVDVDGSCLLETEGRRIRVPLANLSGHDRDYIREAGIRLAALRDARQRAAAPATTPQATDTAGL